MTDKTPRSKPHRPHHWRRDVVELAALFTAVAVADTVAKTVAHAPDGRITLCVTALALLVTAAVHVWWSRRHSHAPPGSPSADAAPRPPLRGDTGATAADPRERGTQGAPAAAGATSLWRMRTTVREEPGALAALCTALARQRVDILSLQTHPLGDRAVDEFLLRSPAALESSVLARLADEAGGADTWLERADAHDLVDVPTRVLGLATRTAVDTAELPLALRQLLGRCTIRSLPAASPSGRPGPGEVPAEGAWEETVLRLPDPAGGALVVERPHLPFTPAEFARARALVELDTRLGAGARVPRGREGLTLPEGQAITVRRADTRDVPAAREMHRRCSRRTLAQRYHGPSGDADRYLDHLLSPRFGRTLAVETASGRLVALGHLLWDGDETEVALLVEDAWQGRGIGAELLRRLVALATEAGSPSVYAVTHASNTAMVAAMRGLGLPLDYQVEEGTLVLTAQPSPAPAAAASPGPAPDPVPESRPEAG